MKYSFAAVAITLAAGVSAQGLAALADLPGCALKCLTGGLATTGCGTEIGCACAKKDFVDGAVACVTAACTEEETAVAVEGASALCKSFGVDIEIPTGEEPAEEPKEETTTTAAPTTTAPPAEEETEEPKETTTTAPTSTAAPVVPPTNGTNGTNPTAPPQEEDSSAGKLAVSGLFAAGLGLAVAFGL